MEIYIEYAFLENFLYDGALLALALTAGKVRIKWLRVIFSACVGAVFAILFPLLHLPSLLGTLLKISVGFLLCMLAFGQLKTKKEWGRYALTCVFFFCFSFGFGGALLGVYSEFEISEREYLVEKFPSVAVFVGFAFLSFVALLLVRKLYARRAVFQSIYPCKLRSENKETQTLGFLDSGNLAIKNGLPVCFLSPELLFDLFFGKETGQVCDEMKISTLAGEKKVPLYKGELELEEKKIQVYFAPSSNMIGREYKVLLNAGALEKTDEADRTR